MAFLYLSIRDISFITDIMLFQLLPDLIYSANVRPVSASVLAPVIQCASTTRDTG